MSDETYTQCLLRCSDSRQCTYISHRAFIPSKFAVFGTFVKIRTDSKGEWSGNWLVVEVGQTMKRDDVQAIQRAYAKSGVNQ